MSFKVFFQEQLSHLNLKTLRQFSQQRCRLSALDFLDKKGYVIC